jgi:hypothetical protein
MKDPVSRLDLPVPPPWPNGPTRRVDELFRMVFVDQLLFVHLLRSLLETTKEVMLALLISPRRPESPYFDSWDRLGNLEVEQFLDWSPAHPSLGPFELLLRKNPEIGLDIIAELVNFATDRAASAAPEEGSRDRSYPIPGWGEWAGD